MKIKPGVGRVIGGPPSDKNEPVTYTSLHSLLRAVLSAVSQDITNIYYLNITD